MKSGLLILVGLIIHTSNIFAGSANVNLDAVGRIMALDGKTRIGAGFVAGDSHNIYMPAHVAIADTLIFFPYGSEYNFKITVKYVLECFDLAIYQRTAGEQPMTLPIGDVKRMRPGDRVIYVGWETNQLLGIMDTIITSIGETLDDGEIVDFIEFYGHGKPGYSGSPVFNSKGEIIAMIVGGWDTKGVRSNEIRRVVRAYSINLLRILEQRLERSTKPDTTSDDKALRLIDVLNEK